MNLSTFDKIKLHFRKWWSVYLIVLLGIVGVVSVAIVIVAAALIVIYKKRTVNPGKFFISSSKIEILAELEAKTKELNSHETDIHKEIYKYVGIKGYSYTGKEKNEIDGMCKDLKDEIPGEMIVVINDAGDAYYDTMKNLLSKLKVIMTERDAIIEKLNKIYNTKYGVEYNTKSLIGRKNKIEALLSVLNEPNP